MILYEVWPCLKNQIWYFSQLSKNILLFVLTFEISGITCNFSLGNFHNLQITPEIYISYIRHILRNYLNLKDIERKSFLLEWPANQLIHFKKHWRNSNHVYFQRIIQSYNNPLKWNKLRLRFFLFGYAPSFKNLKKTFKNHDLNEIIVLHINE